jgi:hypothetical protein
VAGPSDTGGPVFMCLPSHNSRLGLLEHRQTQQGAGALSFAHNLSEFLAKELHSEEAPRSY